MLDRVENKLEVLDILRSLSKDLYHISTQNPCQRTRGKAGWDLLKAVQAIKVNQRQYVSLCDQVMTDTQLYDFLQTQNIQILLK